MCGLAGFLSARAYPDEVLRRMTEAIRHRGPDADGYYRDGPVQLGHRRLSVLDLAGSAQPMIGDGGDLALVYNGEIYNFRELRAELERAGHVFSTRGDTEILLRGYAEWGIDVLKRLAGMFAFALWDRRRRALLLARDPIGIKPLYYAWRDQTLVFGSELKALLPHPAVDREIDPEAIGLFLECQYIPTPRSIYRHVRKLPAGHYLWLQEGKLVERRYWSPSYTDKLDLSEEEAVTALERELRASVDSMLVSDVPLGAFVSGGIDSSLVAALMTQCMGRPVDTFNLGFSGNTSHSEHEEAQRVARHLGANHHPLMVGPQDVLDAFDDWVGVYDEPFGDQAALPTMLLSRLTRGHVTVVLTGEGADEVFAGYGNYGKRIREERLTAWLGSRYSPLPHLLPLLPAVLRKDRLLKAVGRPLAQRYTTIPNLFDSALHDGWFSPQFRAVHRTHVAEYAEGYFRECNSADYLDKLLHVDLRLWLPDDLLTKVDRATMAYSLEARVPYLDHRFVEFAARLRPSLKLRGDTRKFLLKRLAEKYLPHDIVHRPKQGFVMPLHDWLDGGLRPLLEDCLGKAGIGRRNLFRPGVVSRLLAEQRRGRRAHATRLWALLVLELWFRRYAPDFAVGPESARRSVPEVVPGTTELESPTGRG